MGWLGKIGAVLLMFLGSVFGVHFSSIHDMDSRASSTTQAPNTVHAAPQITGDDFAYTTYGNFVIPYPTGWTATDVSSGKGDQFQIYLEDEANPQKTSPIRINISLVNTQSYVGGPDEIVEDYAVQKMGNVTFAGLNQVGVRYHSTNPNYPTRYEYVVFTPYGGLWIDTSYEPSAPATILASTARISSVDLINFILSNITISPSSSAPVISSSTKQYLGSHFSIDATDVYYGGNPIGADPLTFKLISTTTASVVGVDKDAVYALYNYGYSSTVKKLDGADPATFKVFPGGEYAADKNHVYYWGLNGQDYGPYLYEVIPGADPATFHLVNGRKDIDAEDGAHVYLKGVQQ